MPKERDDLPPMTDEQKFWFVFVIPLGERERFPAAAKEIPAKGAANNPSRDPDRRRLVRAPLLSRASEVHSLSGQ
jgi:hypothetical protein